MAASFIHTGDGASQFVFGDVICLVDYFNDRDLSLLDNVQNDSYLTTSYKIRQTGVRRTSMFCVLP